MRILIIEDEKYTARDLAATIRDLDDNAEILPVIPSADEALFFFQQAPAIDLIFSDIDLGDGLVFDVFSKVDVQAPVVFCTAFEQYTLEAFQSYGIDYILKPFSRADVERALLKYRRLEHLFSDGPRRIREAYQQATERQAAAARAVLVQQGDKFLPVALADIAFFVVEHDMVALHTFGQKRYFLNERLETLELKCGTDFFRVNRQFLVNRQAVVTASKYFHRKMVLQLSVPYKEPVLVGKLKTTAFLEWLGRG